MFSLLVLSLASARASGGQPSGLAESLGISFPSDSSSTVVLERDGKRYVIDAAAKSIHELAGDASTAPTFIKNCASCHGERGQGIKAVGTPNFQDPAFQKRITEAEISIAIHNGKGGIMPAWSGKLTENQISGLVSYVRSLQGDGAAGGSAGPVTTASTAGNSTAVPAKPTIYEPGDDVLMSLPTGRPIQRHGVYVNFAHRFAYDPAFTGTGRGEVLLGLDGFAIPSFGFTYGITDKFSASIYRSSSIIGRPIQLMASYHMLDEHHGAPFNLAVRVSIEGQNNFRKNFTENIEGIFSRSLTRRAQIYAVPTISLNDRPLVQGGFRSRDILDFPGTNTFSLGVGLAVISAPPSRFWPK